MPETIEQKAHRLLTEGRLVVERVSGSGLVIATCRGMSAGETYKLGYDPTQKEWRCTCEASAKFHRRCSHLVALQLVVTQERRAA